MVNLSAIRDLLLPALHIASEKRGQPLDMIIDFRVDDIVVRDGAREILIISRDELEDGSYKKTFAPRLSAALKEESHAET